MLAAFSITGLHPVLVYFALAGLYEISKMKDTGNISNAKKSVMLTGSDVSV